MVFSEEMNRQMYKGNVRRTELGAKETLCVPVVTVRERDEDAHSQAGSSKGRETSAPSQEILRRQNRLQANHWM